MLTCDEGHEDITSEGTAPAGANTTGPLREGTPPPGANTTGPLREGTPPPAGANELFVLSPESYRLLDQLLTPSPFQGAALPPDAEAAAEAAALALAAAQAEAEETQRRAADAQAKLKEAAAINKAATAAKKAAAAAIQREEQAAAAAKQLEDLQAQLDATRQALRDVLDNSALDSTAAMEAYEAAKAAMALHRAGPAAARPAAARPAAAKPAAARPAAAKPASRKRKSSTPASSSTGEEGEEGEEEAPKKITKKPKDLLNKYGEIDIPRLMENNVLKVDQLVHAKMHCTGGKSQVPIRHAVGKLLTDGQIEVVTPSSRPDISNTVQIGDVFKGPYPFSKAFNGHVGGWNTVFVERDGELVSLFKLKTEFYNKLAAEAAAAAE